MKDNLEEKLETSDSYKCNNAHRGLHGADQRVGHRLDGSYFCRHCGATLVERHGFMLTAPTAYWWCAACDVEVDSRNVTFEEKHDACGNAVESRVASSAAPSESAEKFWFDNQLWEKYPFLDAMDSNTFDQAVEFAELFHRQAARAAAPQNDPDWLTIATALLLKCDVSHNGDIVLAGELAKFLRDINQQCGEAAAPPAPGRDEMFWPPANEDEEHLHEIRNGRTRDYVLTHLKELTGKDLLTNTSWVVEGAYQFADRVQGKAMSDSGASAPERTEEK
jgi:hypothetical protein